MVRRIIRFDDVCETMNWERWDQIESLLDRVGVKPFVAIVPDNRDPKLVVGPVNPRFWDRAREWQAKGWGIGQHGYRHLYDSKDAGLTPWWPQSEFAGHPYSTQSSRIKEGIKRLQAERLQPKIWIAPSHSFDEVTLQVLQEVKMNIISDGVGGKVLRDARGLTWIPARPSRFKLLPARVVTRIYHSNTLRDMSSVETYISHHLPEIMGVGFELSGLVREGVARAYWDRVFERLYWCAYFCLRGIKRRFRVF
ncbi:MAG: DUF2334 domain-containing protein [Acidobacteria bacterium]|nr:DUF2334 domain-containing protein [Acidobacteriota bacterium]